MFPETKSRETSVKSAKILVETPFRESFEATDSIHRVKAETGKAEVQSLRGNHLLTSATRDTVFSDFC